MCEQRKLARSSKDNNFSAHALIRTQELLSPCTGAKAAKANSRPLHKHTRHKLRNFECTSEFIGDCCHKSHRETTRILEAKSHLPLAKVPNRALINSQPHSAALVLIALQSDAPPAADLDGDDFYFCAPPLPATPRQSGSMFVGVCESDRSKRLPLSG